MKIKASIIANNANVDKLINAISKTNKYKIIKVLNHLDDINVFKYSDAIFVDDSLENNEKRKIERFCLDNNIDFNLCPTSIYIRKTNIIAVDDFCLINLKPYRLSKIEEFFKRLFDITFSLIFLIISFPLFVFLILLIKIFDGGPVFYLQRRLTKGEKSFVIYKFRTMKVNAERNTGAVLSCTNDERLTKTGKFLRRFSLDEIPQMYNVLLGHMSIVGPRPERSFFTNKYKRLNEYYKYRFNVKAGMTGYAQIYGKYESSFRNKLDFDLYYISNYSFFNDLKIIIKTIAHVFSKIKFNNKKQPKTQTKETSKWKKQVGKN